MFQVVEQGGRHLEALSAHIDRRSGHAVDAAPLEIRQQHVTGNASFDIRSYNRFLPQIQINIIDMTPPAMTNGNQPPWMILSELRQETSRRA